MSKEKTCETKYHNVGVLICPDCRYIEFPGCGVHASLLTVKKGNGHMACSGCVKDEEEDESLKNNLLSHIAATDVSSPWCEACRNCNKVKADPYCYIWNEEEADKASEAVKSEREDMVTFTFLVCSVCKVVHYPILNERLPRKVKVLGVKEEKKGK